jgi:hypothetical protein
MQFGNVLMTSGTSDSHLSGRSETDTGDSSLLIAVLSTAAVTESTAGNP